VNAERADRARRLHDRDANWQRKVQRAAPGISVGDVAAVIAFVAGFLTVLQAGRTSPISPSG
jgi:hypothetical protein